MKVAIVGGGVAGLGIGWRLAQRGVETVVVERAQAGCGATWAAAGLISAMENKAEQSGGEADFARHSARLWPDFAAEIERESGISIHYRADGRLVIAQSADESDVLSKQAQRGAGQMLGPEAARRLEPLLTHELVGALWDKQNACVNNRTLGPALAAAFVKAGGSLLLDEAVVRIESHGNQISGLETPFALHEADAYVLAAGAWSACIEGLVPEAIPPVFPVKGEMLALKAPAGALLPRMAIGGHDVYLLSRRDHLLVGATVSRGGFDTSPTAEAAHWLMENALALIPSLRDWTIEEHWAGLRPGSPDELPLLGRSAMEGLYVASGQYRNGILYAPAVADAIAALVLGESVPLDIAAFDPRRFARPTDPLGTPFG